MESAEVFDLLKFNFSKKKEKNSLTGYRGHPLQMSAENRFTQITPYSNWGQNMLYTKTWEVLHWERISMLTVSSLACKCVFY